MGVALALAETGVSRAQQDQGVLVPGEPGLPVGGRDALPALRRLAARARLNEGPRR
jgi:hypothetical protein